MPDAPRYVLIDTKGRAENIKDGYGWFDILDYVNAQHMSAGGNTPLPSILLKDGKIIVPGHITDISWKYCRQRQARIDAAVAVTRAEFPEPEAPDGQ